MIMLACSLAAKELAFIQCFNDAWMAFFMVLFVYCQQRSHAVLAALFFACSLSIKMSAILMLPGLLLTSVFAYGIPRTFLMVLFIVAFQFVIAIPFLMENHKTYLEQSYDFSRTFSYSCVNAWQIVSKKTYKSSAFSNAMLYITLGLLTSFLLFKWTNIRTFFKDVRLFPLTTERRKVRPYAIIHILFVCNFIGCVFTPAGHR